MAAILRQPASGMRVFTIIWLGQLVSKLGSGLTSFALGVWIYEQTDSATLFAFSMLVYTLPFVLVLPFAGVLTDRWDRRRVMMLSDSGAGVASLFIVLILVTSELQIWQVYLAIFFNSAFSAFQWPALSAATSLLVPKEQLGRASGMTQGTEAVSQLAAPAIAGAVYVVAGLPAILAIDVTTYIFAMLTLLAVRFPQPEPVSSAERGQTEDKQGFWREITFGWHYIRQRKGLFGLLVIFASMNFLLSLVWPLLTPMLLDLSAPDVTGLVHSAGGVGMLAGTLLMAAWGGPKRRIAGIIAAEALTALAALLLGLRPAILTVAAGLFGIMFFQPVSNGCSQAIWQTKVAPGVQGRVFSIRSTIAFSIIPLAYALSGPLAERVFMPWLESAAPLAQAYLSMAGSGPGRTIGVMWMLAGGLYFLLAMVIWIYPPTRNVERILPDAVS